MTKGERCFFIQKETLSRVNFDTIHSRADIRRREQRIKIEMMNIRQPWTTEAMKTAEDRVREIVAKEASGKNPLPGEKDVDELLEEASILQRKAEDAIELFPELAAYCFAKMTKLRLSAGCEVGNEIAVTQNTIDLSHDKPVVAASGLLPDAILLGVQKELAQKTPLPTIEQVAQMVIVDKKLLIDYALILSEQDRPKFLALIPDEYRREIAVALDESVSRVLHQAVVGKGTEEDKQRKEVRLRIYEEMQKVLQEGKKSDKKMGAALARSLGNLGGDSRLLLLELVREEIESGSLDKQKEQEYLPHAIGVLVNQFDDYRVNDIALQLVGDARMFAPVRRNLLHKLVKRGYLPKNVGEWWIERSAKFSEGSLGLAQDWEERLNLLQKVIADLGIVPSREVLEFLDNDVRWGEISFEERVEKIRASQVEFAGVKTQRELVEILVNDETKSMVYYVLHGGEDRFNLINNYSFKKFKEMLKLIADLRVHEEPIKKFQRLLQESGMGDAQIAEITKRLRAGHYPLAEATQARQEVSFEISENAAVKNANAEIGRILGREQLGVILLFPLFREYLEKEPVNNDTRILLKKMSSAHTFSERLVVISQIEEVYPEWREKAKGELQESWRALGEKMVLEMTLDQVLAEGSVPIRGEELLPRLSSKRTDLKRMKKDLLVALRGGNEKLDKLHRDLSKKKKAKSQLLLGLEKQTEETKRRELQTKIDMLEKEIGDLEKQTVALADAKVSERFAHLNPKEREEVTEKIGREIIALTEKSHSAIFTYLTMQVLGEERLTESDVTLVQEMESHLQGPFQTIADHLTYQPTGKEGGTKKTARVALQYMDKTTRLMNMVRFADSKICCFSSSNYEMRVQHNTPNKYWVASINADPMSFVISMEVPQGEIPEEGSERQVAENLGFIFGSFAIDEDGKLAIMLNGIYYAPGIEDSKQVEVILSGVQRIFDGLPVKNLAIATQYGGAVKMPAGYANGVVKFTRLRALDAGDGTPETKVYDDLGTGSDLNKPKVYNAGYSGNLWHKKI